MVGLDTFSNKRLFCFSFSNFMFGARTHIIERDVIDSGEKQRRQQFNPPFDVFLV